MGSQAKTGIRSHPETIEGLKKELQIHIANLKASTDWADFAGLYKALVRTEEVSGAPKTSLEELLGLTDRSTSGAQQNAKGKTVRSRSDQVESELATEVEKGS